MILIQTSMGGHSHSHSMEDDEGNNTNDHDHVHSHSHGNEHAHQNISDNHNHNHNLLTQKNGIGSTDDNLLKISTTNLTNNNNNPTNNISQKGHENLLPSPVIDNDSIPKSSALIMAVGLSVHNILEGISIGLSPN